MRTVDGNVLAICVDKNNKLSSAYLRTQIGTSQDGFITVSIELKDKSVLTIRLGEICNLVQKSGLKC
ncbi:MAG: hypothetical protein IJA23_06085 [Clostridia bacterium]|nr:hypothetical protein [Clostridia bacterium]